jgi:hypothetical protein
VVGVEIEGPAAKDEGLVVFASPRGQVGQAGQSVGGARLDVEGPAKGIFGPLEIPAPRQEPGLEDDEVGVAGMLGQERVEDRLGLVPFSGIGVGPGEKEPDLGVGWIGLEGFEGEDDRLLVVPGDEGLPDVVPALARGGRSHRHSQAEPEGGRV